MVFLSLLLALIFLYMVFSSSRSPRSGNDSIPPSSLLRNYQDHHRDPYYQRSPLFSPDKKYIWNGENWVRNDGGFGRGLLIGMIISAVIFYMLF